MASSDDTFRRKQQAFHANPDINPNTGRKLIIGKGPYNKFVEKYGAPTFVPFMPSIVRPPITEITETTKTTETTELVSDNIINDVAFNRGYRSLNRPISFTEKLWYNRMDNPSVMNDRYLNRVSLIGQSQNYAETS